MNAQPEQIDPATYWQAKDPKNQPIFDAVRRCLEAGEERAASGQPDRALRPGERVHGEGVDL